MSAQTAIDQNLSLSGLGLSQRWTYIKSMMTLPEFKQTSSLTLSEVSDLLREVPKKLIRNLTDRGLVDMAHDQLDPRLYTLANALELLVMHEIAKGEASYMVGSLIARMAVSRAEERITSGLAGSGEQMHVAVCLLKLDPEKAETTLLWWITPYAEVGSTLADMANRGRPHFHVVAVDHLIDALVSRWAERRERVSEAQT